nr:serine/threonine-protein kinase D6PKL2-like [Ipomoea batatas]
MSPGAPGKCLLIKKRKQSDRECKGTVRFLKKSSEEPAAYTKTSEPPQNKCRAENAESGRPVCAAGSTSTDGNLPWRRSATLLGRDSHGKIFQNKQSASLRIEPSCIQTVLCCYPQTCFSPLASFSSKSKKSRKPKTDIGNQSFPSYLGADAEPRQMLGRMSL